MSINEFEKNIGVEFNSKFLIKEALTHRSYLNENPNWPVDNNERLEFLGDAVLELVVTEFLFNKFKDKDEGKLTSIRAALVNHNMLTITANTINLDNYIKLSKGEANGVEKAKEVIIGNAVEAIIGAIYIDQGYEKVKEFIEKFILINLETIMKEESYRDPKSFLQEIIQGNKKITPNYKILEEDGPDHEKKFVVGVFFGDKLSAKGVGTSKQEAERVAAEEALKKINNE
ncbi:MAG: ribonuclease III [Candidatus Paceibacterota bacterium]